MKKSRKKSTKKLQRGSSKLQLLIIILILGVLTGFALQYIRDHYEIPVTSTAVNDPLPIHTPPPPKTSTSTSESSTTSLATLLLKVPFTTQAPFANWDTIHNEDCEEAASVMANAYYNGPHDVKLDPSFVDGQLTMLTNWEMQNFGYNLDINSEEVVKMIQANFQLQAKVVSGFSLDEIKSELQQNHLILIAENGQMLGNPNYRSPGPVYHMLLIRGYTPNSIITNDPGTRNGLNYTYSFDTLYNANGEFDHSTGKVDLSKKNIIVVWR